MFIRGENLASHGQILIYYLFWPYKCLVFFSYNNSRFNDYFASGLFDMLVRSQPYQIVNHSIFNQLCCVSVDAICIMATFVSALLKLYYTSSFWQVLNVLYTDLKKYNYLNYAILNEPQKSQS